MYLQCTSSLLYVGGMGIQAIIIVNFVKVNQRHKISYLLHHRLMWRTALNSVVRGQSPPVSRTFSLRVFDK